MATLCASPMAPPCRAIQIQNALASLSPPPASNLPIPPAVNCSATKSLPLGQAHSEVGPPTEKHIAPTQKHVAPTPPATPISSGPSIIPAQLGIINTAPTGTLTPQNSIPR